MLENDLEILEQAMREFFQTMKRPQHWAHITERSGVSIDRPSAVILKLLQNASSPLRIQDLADHLGIEAPFVTRKTQDLERAGYIRRVPDENDRRAVDLYLTSQGQTVTTKLWQVQREIITEALRQWKPSERHRFVTLFGRFSDDLKCVAGPASTASQPVEKTARV